MSLVVRECAVCCRESLFQAPPCTDEHDDCPELLCVGCGAALMLGGSAGCAESQHGSEAPDAGAQRRPGAAA